VKYYGAYMRRSPPQCCRRATTGYGGDARRVYALSLLLWWLWFMPRCKVVRKAI